MTLQDRQVPLTHLSALVTHRERKKQTQFLSLIPEICINITGPLQTLVYFARQLVPELQMVAPVDVL